MQVDTNQEGNWVTLKVNPEYEIYDQAPHYLRRGTIIYKPSLTSNSGYAVYHLKGITETLHHRIIASQFIDNDDPETKTIVNHIDGNTMNNSISNLEWLSQSQNIKLRARYKQQPHINIDELPPDAVCLGDYDGHSYSRYWVCGENLIMQNKRCKNKTQYKYVNASPYRHGEHRSVTLYDDNGVKSVKGLSKLLRVVNGNADQVR